jgi:signal peptidase I
MDFDMDWVASEALLLPKVKYTTHDFHSEVSRRVNVGDFEIRKINGEEVRCIRTGIKVRKGERFLSFDELTGDQLFVDRMSYHFVRPQPGQGFVFRTGNIPYIADRSGDQYYIKRLVGVPGDELEIVSGKTLSDGVTIVKSAGAGGVLLRNGKPIQGSDAFVGNNEKSGNYDGYQQRGMLDAGEKMKVPPGKFVALGDNSFNSEDGRYWGYVPGKDVAGRPLFIYFPFSKHWGPAR